MKKMLFTALLLAGILSLPFLSKASFFDGGTDQFLTLEPDPSAEEFRYVGTATANVASGYYYLKGFLDEGGLDVKSIYVLSGPQLTVLHNKSSLLSNGVYELGQYQGGQLVFEITVRVDPNQSNFCGQLALTLDLYSVAAGEIEKETLNLKLRPELDIESNGNAILSCPDKKVSLAASGPRTRVNLSCPPVMEMSVVECSYNPATMEYSPLWGTEAKRALNFSEISDLVNSNLVINSFVGNSNTINIVPDKHYLVTIVNLATGGEWIPSYHYFHTKSGQHDYAMRDFDFQHKTRGHVIDLGMEPSSDKWEHYFSSPDIWNNLPPGAPGAKDFHHNPDFVSAGNDGNMLRFNIRNIGCNTSNPTQNHELRLFWTRARTDELWDEHWTYDMTNNSVTPTGGGTPVAAGAEITIIDPTDYSSASSPIVLQNISTASDYLTQVGVSGTEAEWFPPDPADFDVNNGSMNGEGHPVICLLARINETTNADDPILWEPTVGNPSTPELPIVPYVAYSNNIAARNMSLVDDDGYLVNDGSDWNYGFGTIWTNNDKPTDRDMTVCFDLLETDLAGSLFDDFGHIEIGMTEGIWGEWVANGMEGENVTVLEPTLVEVSGTHACLENITLEPGNEEQIGVRFVYDGTATLPASEIRYTYVLNPIYEENTPGTAVAFSVGVPTESPLVAGKTNLNVKEQKAQNQGLTVVPNPAKNSFLLSAKVLDNTDYTISVLDVQGRVIEKINGKSSSSVINHSFNTIEYPSGMYFVVLQNGNTTQQKKVIVVD